ncbi:MAG: periplasmic heavy metal sensor [Bacteroidota bacterium]
MDIFAQRKLLIRIVIILIFLNVLSVGVFLCKDIFHKPPRQEQQKEKHDVTDVLKRELNLSEEQFKHFKDVRSSFFEKEKHLSEAIRAERDSMNEAMFNKTTNEEQVKALAKSIADNEYNMELLRLEQSKQLKTICTAEQMDKFGKLVRDIRDYLRPEPKQDKK